MQYLRSLGAKRRRHSGGPHSWSRQSRCGRGWRQYYNTNNDIQNPNQTSPLFDWLFALFRYFRTSYERKNRFLELSRNQLWNRVTISQNMLIFKTGIDFVLGSSLPPLKNLFNDGIDSHKESFLWNQMPGILKSLKIWALLLTRFRHLCILHVS